MSIFDELKSVLSPAGDFSPGLAVVLGSGHGGFVESMEIYAEIPYGELPHSPVSNVPGHEGKIVMGSLGDIALAVFSGRFHYYEGCSDLQVALPMLAAHVMGVGKAILTCAVGSVSPEIGAGEILVVEDHINMSGRNPLVGLAGIDPGRDRFIDVTNTYRTDFTDELIEAGSAAGIRVHRGVLAALLGPSYETPAEVGMLRGMGADVVCMSTVPDAIVAGWLGMEVIGLCLATNPAGRKHGDKLTHDHVLEVGRAAEEQFGAVLSRAIEVF